MDFTYETVNKLYAKGLITAKERSLLRIKVLNEDNQIEGLSGRFVTNLVDDFKKGWADLVVALKQTGEEKGKSNLGKSAPTGIADLLIQAATTTDAEGKLGIAPQAKAAWHALQLLTLSPIITGGGRAAGEHLQDVLLKHGAGPDVAAVAGAFLDAGAQMRAAKGLAQATGLLPKASEVTAWFQKDKLAAARFAAKISDETTKKAQALVNAHAKAAEKEAERFIDARAPSKGLEDLIDAFDTTAPGVKEDLARYRAILDDPRLINFAAQADTGFDIQLAIPVGGKRVSGELNFLTREHAERFIQQVQGNKGFPNVRHEKVGGENTVAWGEVQDWLADHATIGKRFGYSDKAVAENQARNAAIAASAKQAEESAAEVMRRNEETHDLLGKAMETFQPRQLSETEKTLQAAAATLRGRETAEQILNAASLRRIQSSADNLVESQAVQFSGVNPKIIQRLKDAGKSDEEIARILAPGGGAPTYQDYIDAGKRAQGAYAEGKRVLEMGKTKIADIEEIARTMVGKNLSDLKNITPGDPVDPLEVIANSMAVKDHAQELMKLIGTMRTDWQGGNKSTFYRAWAEFHKMLEIDPNYRMPLQTAGQTLRAAGNPAVNSTRYLDEIVKTGSWINGEKINTLDELEANALNIMARLEQIPSWEKAANLAKQIAGQGEEVLRDPTFRDKARFLFINSIMSGTDTMGRNASGNLIAAPWHYAEKMTGVAAAKVLNPFLSAKHHIEAGYASEANDFITTWASAMWDGTRYALTRRWDKLAEMVPGNARAELFANRFDLARFKNTGTTNPFSGTGGRIVGTPVGVAQGADEVARVALYRGAVSERLKHEWLTSGSDMPWGEFRERGFANVAPAMHDYGVRMAGLMTYSDDPSIFGRLVLQGREAIPGSEFLVPFVRTTDRLMAFGYNRSPILSALSTKTIGEFRSGDPLIRQEAIGRILLANITGVGLFLAARGKAPDGETFITGGGPTNRALAKSLREGEVIHPYTFWTPAGRFNYHLWQPIAAPLGMIADAAEIWDELKTPDAESLWSGISLALSRNLFDTTYNQQIADVISIFDNPSDEDNTARLMRKMGASIVKGFTQPAIVRQMLKVYDPSVKEVYSFQDELLRDIPGYGGPAKINPRTGEPIMNPPRLLQGTPFGWFLPNAPIVVEDDAIRNKFLELKMPFPKFPKAYGGGNPSEASFAYSGPLGPVKEAGAGVAYTPDQLNKGQRYIHEPDESGVTVNDELKEMFADPEFHKLAPIIQAEQIQGIYNSRLNRSVGRLREEYPELDEQLEAKRQLRGELRMSPEDREGFQAEESSQPDPVNELAEESRLDNPVLGLEAAEQAQQPEAAP